MGPFTEKGKSMDLPQETDDYIRESIEHSLGLPVSTKTLQLKLLAADDDRHRLQDQIFLLQDRLKESQKRVDQYRVCERLLLCFVSCENLGVLC